MAGESPVSDIDMRTDGGLAVNHAIHHAANCAVSSSATNSAVACISDAATANAKDFPCGQ
ncbi:hypothetical protein [Bifidobacterium subtile]|jgi:hypothetical protein|uniref:hypothetical protein n=1 Tax=Bifidobacterium subtile TaxID=77635 RepID=UPI00040913CE|nr:hypothetical protein [Bifidobacterium subtile]MCI1223011.1 hypothetical protein [Bifidobacterium subtile]MCI1241590.1 hypothetical protein [Bifidobacterium subtile]MCI1258357.1 hypothetical protein [Bifidobacterium subtile]QOL35679.1 hypothetical protein BS3272_06920 [Bifidobacterium subtile]